MPETPSLATSLGLLGPVPSFEPLIPESPATPPRRPAPAHPGIDWLVVVGLRRTAAEQIASAGEQWKSDKGFDMPDEDRRVRARAIIRAVVHAHASQLNHDGQALWTLETEQRYAEAVESAIFGYGRLQPLFELAEAENIEIHGFDSVTIQYGDGRRVPHPPVADTDDELVEAVRFLGETATPPRPFDDAHPTMTLALGATHRLHAIGFGLSYRPSVVIRQHRLTHITLDELADTGMFTRELASLLRASVLARKSIVVSGDQGAGKTTLLRALIDAIPASERFGTLETDYELLTHLHEHRRNILALQARIGLGESAGGKAVGTFTVADLIPEALRQNLSRLVVGEVRGEEAGAMFEAMQSGAGTLSTTHSHSATSTIDRLASRVAQGGVITIDEAMRQIAHHIGLIVHVVLRDDTWRGGRRTRFVREVRQLTGSLEGGRPTTHLVYQASQDGRPHFFDPSAELLAELAEFRERR